MKTSVKFLLNGTPVEIDFLQEKQLYPHMTVMDYLREHAHLTGTKEGCGIGDCGACTVCLAERDAFGNTIISSVNGCLIMLGMLDNKHLITIEGVAKNGKLHPVQQSLVEKRGSQCGFCSPGMVMSAYAHYLNKKPFTRLSIESSLSGNLCRCTGYESILQALLDVEKYERLEVNLELPDNLREEIFIEQGESVYIKPLDLQSLLKYKQWYPQYTLVSGASDLSVKYKTEHPCTVKLIDVSDIEELKGVNINKDNLTIGANISIESAKGVLSVYYPQVSEYLSSFASLQIRNKASLAGSVAGASPVGDIMPLLLALRARIVLASDKSSRTIESHDFNTAYRKHIMEDNEIIEKFIFPIPAKGQKLFCNKQSKRKDMDISSMAFCISFTIDNEVIRNVATGFGGMAAVPCASRKIEEFLNGKPFAEDTFIKAKSLVRQEFSTISDMRGSAEYRLMVAENLLIKCYNDLK